MAKPRKARRASGELFVEPSGQLRLADKSVEQQTIEQRKVECLGMTFESDPARRAYFLAKLSQHLKNPDFRKIEGFPKGEDEDILALSDPPYYTACPNPFFSDVVRFCVETRSSRNNHDVEPFASDVSEGKNEPLYNLHSYHTKVPPKAIRHYLEHYTKPGDLILDCFCGSGMTGVAASIEGRTALLCDLSPAATFITSHCTDAVSLRAAENELAAALKQLQEKWAHLWQTLHNGESTSSPLRKISKKPGKQTTLKGQINFVIWSDVFLCAECGSDVTFLETALDTKAGKILDEFPCPSCHALVSKRSLQRKWTTVRDDLLRKTIKAQVRVPVLIFYTFQGKRYRKGPDEFDLALLQEIDRLPISNWVPTDLLPEGDKTGDPLSVGVTNIHHFYSKRNLLILSDLWAHSDARSKVRFLTSALTPRATMMHRVAASRIAGPKAGEGGMTVGIINGTLYVPAVIVEMNSIEQFAGRAREMMAALRTLPERRLSFVTTQSATNLSQIPADSVDYVFVDPPFGANLIYSELNLLWEGWLKVHTDNGAEAIISGTQRKNLPEYQSLMEQCFSELRRVLKPGRWITVEFHNSQNSVWVSIQEALARAGFVIADVRVLDKKQGSFNAITAAGAVKQDLVISGYKPAQQLEERFALEAGTPTGAWEFVREHLKHLPRFVEEKGKVEIVAERQAFLLFDRMVAFHIQRGATVPMSAAEFYGGLRARFPERDGMYFLPEQVAEYDRKRLRAQEIGQLELFVNDERSAIEWLRQQLSRKPQTYQQIQPRFLRELHKAGHEQLPELRDLLQQSFLEDEKHRWYVPDPKKQVDLEKLREKALLREFEEYKTASQKKLKVFRAEAVRAGFKIAWSARDYQTIVAVARKLPDDVVQEDQTLVMYYDNASVRLE